MCKIAKMLCMGTGGIDFTFSTLMSKSSSPVTVPMSNVGTSNADFLAGGPPSLSVEGRLPEVAILFSTFELTKKGHVVV